MASLKELKGRINSVKSTQKITKAKQMVAAAKLRKAQAAAEAARPYAVRLAEVMASLAAKVSGDSAPPLLAGTGNDQRHLLVVVNTDKGLCGGLNANIVKAAKAKARALIAEGKTVEFYLVGRKGRAPIRRDYADRIAQQFDTSEVRTPGFEEASSIADELIAMYQAGKFDVAHLIYPVFQSALAQEPTVQQIVPVPAPTTASANDAVVEYEPGEEEILEALLPRYVKTQLFGALLEREASEHGASMTAMDNATRNAGELIDKLTIQYNRSRQAAITTELIENHRRSRSAVKKILLLSVLGMLAACQSQAPSDAAQGDVVSGSPEAVEKDIAANEHDPVTASGKKVDAASMQAALDAQCPDLKVQNASCKTTDDPTQFRCDYALKGENVFDMKHTTIAEDGDGWKLIDIPTNCTKQ